MTAHLSRFRFFVCCFFSVCLSAGLLASLFVLCQFVDVIWFNSFVCHTQVFSFFEQFRFCLSQSSAFQSDNFCLIVFI